MLVADSKNRRPKRTAAAVAEVLRGVSAEKLRAFVDMLAFPRHYVAERKANFRARDLVLKLLDTFGYTPLLQGTFDNIVVTSSGAEEGPYLLLGAHYDSVPGTPGADDNGSAVAVCLECARLVKENEIGSTMIVFFNREEDGLLGSSEFVAHLAAQSTWEVEEAHIFEMVGFCNRAPRSQRMPPGLPGVAAPDVGDFLALLANRREAADVGGQLRSPVSCPGTEDLPWHRKVLRTLAPERPRALLEGRHSVHHVDGHVGVSKSALSSDLGYA
jgi:hypothetical protein